ncbi:OB-fold nucleic acid binding domain-containing protein [Streptomyces sp. NPDC097619]|uniref:OB-fold nucleic acid binding domain-containing protein n=1 Tax=Streptomyces sp. NPDC097619 TaxID=3157228 RepID=UPI003330716A
MFRLAAERQHAETCPLNLVEVLQTIAHGSQGVAVVEGNELHLVLPGDLTGLGAPTPADAGPADVGDRFGLDVVTVRPLLPPLINSAVVIARFLHHHDHDPDVVAQFKVRRPGQARAVSWGEFCHGPTPGDHARLYERLTGGARPDHPVAVYGRITAVQRDRQGRPVVRLADGHGYSVRIRSDHAPLLDRLTAGAFVLAVGMWKVWTPDRGRPELQLFAEEHWQLAHWTYDDTTGRCGPPAYPKPLSLSQRTLRQARTAAAAPRPGRRPEPTPASPPPPALPMPTTPPPAVPPAPAPARATAPVPAPSSPARPDPVTPAAVPLPAKPSLPPRPMSPPEPPAPAEPHRRRKWWPFGRRT